MSMIEIARDMADVRRRIEHLETAEIGTAWENWGPSASFGGFSAMTTTSVYHKKVGRLVFVAFHVVGTSDTTGFTFTLPDTATTGIAVFRNPCEVEDNGVFQTNAGLTTLSAGASTVTVFKVLSGAGTWTASGEKGALGQFFYMSA